MRGFTRWQLSCVALVSCLSCGSDDESCVGSAAASIIVEVHEMSSKATVCEASIHATAPGYDQTVVCGVDGGVPFTWCGTGCQFSIFGLTNVTYLLEVTAAGFAPASSSVFVPGDECDQPKTQSVVIQVQHL